MNAVFGFDAMANATPVPMDTIVDQAQDVIDTANEFDAAQGMRKQHIRATLTKRLDDLLGNLMKFEGEFDVMDAQAVFYKEHRLVREDLDSVKPGVLALAVMREMLSTYRAAVDRPKMKNWSAFEERYIAAVC